MLFLYELFVNHYWRIFISQQIMFLISFSINNPTLIDVAWGFSHILTGLSIASKGFTDSSNLLQTTNLIGLTLTLIWFLRLSGFIFYYRIVNRYDDPRYKELAKKRNLNESVFSFIQFQLQGILAVLTSIPLYFALYNAKRGLNLLNYIAIGIALIAIYGEALADNQLQNFRHVRKSDKELFRGGLFKKARHPNLFFEILFWTSMAIFGISFDDVYTFLTLAGPVILWSIMYFLTIPITNKHMKKNKPDYEKVIAETNMFLPF